MSNDVSETRTSAEMWFDPVCPWAWMTSRWLMEVEQVRPIDITWSVMSLSVLNEGRHLDEGYREMLDRSWGPVRVIVAATKDLPEDEASALRKKLYDAFGQRIHLEHRGTEQLDTIIAEVLEEVGLDASLKDVAGSTEVDDRLRASHQRAIDLVGDDVGTPVVSVNGVSFFGPVVTPAPKGEAAGNLWDGCVLVAGTPGFYEMKRTRDASPDFS
ncbi:mycothiol-dependent nitroreductase Rv2466c family protein [Ornithinimicrobium cryptoxanthini]|uniref:Disulfide bond formation protein DsbA n=1 Tax=Ornithinimicrobium cryptoxanthini TaxID=2934161 RepID=A0ABY4YFB3_9MICO|nr:disulfide bond formation protein DsbA [Ornithinimicrobium cryptoxanthini]USQ75457.1 disulfide bond formation protein DsbA [Ornithinimicrobium cryptoxanthini]